MQEFRPADVIARDTEVAEALAAGDLDALDTLVTRYGRAVRATVATMIGNDHAVGDTVDVFAEAWEDRSSPDGLSPAADFAPWIQGLAVAGTGRATTEQASRAWDLAMAIDAVDSDTRPLLRAHHVDGDELPTTVDRHELRLRRRLSHLGDEAEVLEALTEPLPWVDPAVDLAALVRAAVTPPEPDAAPAAVEHALDEVAEVGDEPDRPSRVTRSLRPVLLGLAGAVAVLFVAIIALSAASGSPDPVVLTADLTPTGAILDVEGGELTVTDSDSGLRLDLDAPTLPRRAGDQFYEGVLVLQDGTELAIGTFNQGFGVTLAAGVSLDRVEEFLVVTGDLGNDESEVVLKLDVPRT